MKRNKKVILLAILLIVVALASFGVYKLCLSSKEERKENNNNINIINFIFSPLLKSSILFDLLIKLRKLKSIFKINLHCNILHLIHILLLL